MERIVEVRTNKKVRFITMSAEEVEASGLDTAEEWSRTESGHYAIEDRYLDEIVEQDDGWEDLYVDNRVRLYEVHYCNEFLGRYLAPQAAARFARLARTACPTEVFDFKDRVVACTDGAVDAAAEESFRDEVWESGETLHWW